MTLSPKHEAFVTEFMRDMDAAAAARRAGYSPRTASGLMSNPGIRAEIAKRQEAAATAAQVSLQSLLDECEQARRVAEGDENASAMVSATALKAKLTGRLVDTFEDAVRRDQLERETSQKGALKTAAELLSDAAQSMGLPRTASPSQIVGAATTRPIATPELYRIMHAMAKEATDAS